MKKFGLALSGGGFRATLYHLGLVTPTSAPLSSNGGKNPGKAEDAATAMGTVPGQSLQGKVVKTLLPNGKNYRREALFDFTKAPAATPTDVITEIQAPGIFLRGSESATGMNFAIEEETGELAQWVLMPKGRIYKTFRYIYYKKDQPETAAEKRFYTQYLSKDHSMLAFKLLALDPGYEHEISWNYE